MKIGNTTLIEFSQADDKIASVKRRGKSLDKDIHITALSLAYHVSQHGDASKLADLCNAMPKGSRVKGLVAWISAHFPAIKVSFNKEAGAYKATAKGWKDAEYLLDAAEACPFWDFTAERNPVARTPLTIIKSAATQMGKLAEAGGDDAELAAKLALALAKVQAMVEAEMAAGDNVVAIAA